MATHVHVAAEPKPNSQSCPPVSTLGARATPARPVFSLCRLSGVVNRSSYVCVACLAQAVQRGGCRGTLLDEFRKAKHGHTLLKEAADLAHDAVAFAGLTKTFDSYQKQVALLLDDGKKARWTRPCLIVDGARGYAARDLCHFCDAAVGHLPRAAGRGHTDVN
jgi:hypothetical protein